MQQQSDTPPLSAETVLPLRAEEITVSRRKVAIATVRVSTTTHTHEEAVEAALTHERFEVEHVPVGRFVEAAPAVREEGDVTIMPILEERLVIERRLFLKEEVHIRRVRITSRHVETVQLRRQQAVTTRTTLTDHHETKSNGDQHDN